MESWTVNFFLFLWIHALSRVRVSFCRILQQSFLLSSSIACSLNILYVFLCPETYLWLQQRQKCAFQVVFHEKRNAAGEFSVRNTRPPFLEVWCCLAIHSNSILVHRDSNGLGRNQLALHKSFKFLTTPPHLDFPPSWPHNRLDCAEYWNFDTQLGCTRCVRMSSSASSPKYTKKNPQMITRTQTSSKPHKTTRWLMAQNKSIDARRGPTSTSTAANRKAATSTCILSKTSAKQLGAPKHETAKKMQNNIVEFDDCE